MDPIEQEVGSGMVEENGLRVYRAADPLPVQTVDDAIRRSREDRARHLLGAIDAGDNSGVAEDGVFARVRTDLMKEGETP